MDSNSTLEAVDLSHNPLGDGGARQVIEGALRAAKLNLTDLDVGGTGAGPLSVSGLSRLLREGDELIRVGLSDLRFTAAHWVDSLLPALAAAPRVVAANLAYNALTPATGAALASCIATAQNLEVVDICGCPLDDDAMVKVAKAMLQPRCRVRMVVTDIPRGRSLLAAMKALKNTPAGKAVAQHPPKRVAMRPGCALEADSYEVDVQLTLPSADSEEREAELLARQAERERVADTADWESVLRADLERVVEAARKNPEKTGVVRPGKCGCDSNAPLPLVNSEFSEKRNACGVMRRRMRGQSALLWLRCAACTPALRCAALHRMRAN